MAKKKTYSWKITLVKGIKYLAFYGIPWLICGFITEYPEIAGLTIGSALVMLSNYLKNGR